MAELSLKERWEQWNPPETLKGCVQLFFEILDQKEYSENTGCMWHPTKFSINDLCINSCRVWDTHRLSKTLKKMKELANE